MGILFKRLDDSVQCTHHVTEDPFWPDHAGLRGDRNGEPVAQIIDGNIERVIGLFPTDMHGYTQLTGKLIHRMVVAIIEYCTEQ